LDKGGSEITDEIVWSYTGRREQLLSPGKCPFLLLVEW
jgi:hypothetical protein